MVHWHVRGNFGLPASALAAHSCVLLEYFCHCHKAIYSGKTLVLPAGFPSAYKIVVVFQSQTRHDVKSLIAFLVLIWF